MAATKNLAAGSHGLSHRDPSAAFAALVVVAAVGMVAGAPALRAVACARGGMLRRAVVRVDLFAPKAFSEVVAAHLFVPALPLLVDRERTRRSAILAGGLLGLAVALRPHCGPAGGRSDLLSLRANARMTAAVGGMRGPAARERPARHVHMGCAVQARSRQPARESRRTSRAAEQHAPWFAYLLPPLRVWGPWTLPLAGLIVLGSRGHRPVVVAAAALFARTADPAQGISLRLFRAGAGDLLAALGYVSSAASSRAAGAPAGDRGVAARCCWRSGVRVGYARPALRLSRGIAQRQLRRAAVHVDALSRHAAVVRSAQRRRQRVRRRASKTATGAAAAATPICTGTCRCSRSTTTTPTNATSPASTCSSPTRLRRRTSAASRAARAGTRVCIYRRARRLPSAFAGYDINQGLIARGD